VPGPARRADAKAEEKEFAKLTIGEVEYIERVQGLIIPKPWIHDPPPRPILKEGTDPLAVGWVRAKDVQSDAAGTHVLEKGNVAQYYSSATTWPRLVR